MHIKERGNEALPVDVVKVLKSQDENYVRTARTVNAKVRRFRINLVVRAQYGV